MLHTLFWKTVQIRFDKGYCYYYNYGILVLYQCAICNRKGQKYNNRNQMFARMGADGRTTAINRDYQHDCLIVKTDVIRENIEQNNEVIYSFSDFLHVLFVGFNEDAFLDIEPNDYDGIKAKIELEYVA